MVVRSIPTLNGDDDVFEKFLPARLSPAGMTEWARQRTATADLTSGPDIPAGLDYTSKLQALINDVSVEAISINSPITISTVLIPPSRPIHIYTNVVRNIVGTPLITVLPGGEGIKLNGSFPSLCAGVKLSRLSFTSLDQPVVGAITGRDATGLFLEDIYVENVYGSAISVKGVWFDSAVENLVAMDCGRPGFPVIQMSGGGGTEDTNRVVWTNPRVERSKTVMLQVDGDAYGNDFYGAKFHGPVSDGSAEIILGASARDNHFYGGQVQLYNTSAAGFQIAGYRNLIHGVMFTRGYQTLGDTAQGVRISGFENIVDDCQFVDVLKPYSSSGEFNSFTNNKMNGAGLIESLSAFGRIESNDFISMRAIDAVATVIDIRGPYSRVEGNTLKTFAAPVAYAIYLSSSGGGSIVKDNIAYGSGNLGSLVRVEASDVIVKDNIAQNVTGAPVSQSGTDATRDIASNKQIAA